MKGCRCIRNSDGFALIEFIATMTFCLAALSVMLFATYAAFSRLWLNRAAYEASICLSTPAVVFSCEKALRESTAKALPVGRIEAVSLSRRSHEVQTRFRWRLNSEFFLSIEDIRHVPLLGDPSKAVL